MRDIRQGDRVVTMAGDCFASHAIAKQELVHRTPRGFTAEEAAGLPIPYLTFAHALRSWPG